MKNILKGIMRSCVELVVRDPGITVMYGIRGFDKAADEIIKFFPSWTKMTEKLPDDKTYCYVRFKNNKTDWCFYNKDMNIDSRFIAGNFGWTGGSDCYSESEVIEYFPESELLKFLKLKKGE